MPWDGNSQMANIPLEQALIPGRDGDRLVALTQTLTPDPEFPIDPDDLGWDPAALPWANRGEWPQAAAPVPIRSLLVCDPQPIVTQGLRSVLSAADEISFMGGAESLEVAFQFVEHRQPDLVLVDKSFGGQATLDWVTRAQAVHPEVRIIIWGSPVSESEAVRYVHHGVRGILRKTADLTAILACLRAVAKGRTWMEDAVVPAALRAQRESRSPLTPREQEVLALVEKGFKNREIAQHLGIRAGTVKIHLKHIFEKTGVHGRYGLAINGLEEKGILELMA